jgi:hypothetical protein
MRCYRPKALAATALVLFLAAACSDTTNPASDGTFRVLDGTAWAGGDIVVRSTGFTGASTGPVFTLAGATLAARQTDDSTWTVTLPTTAAGTTAISVAVNGRSTALNGISVRGFTATHDFDALLHETLLVWPLSGDAIALGSDMTDVLQVNATTSELIRYDSLGMRSLHSPGPTAVDGSFVVWPVDSATPQVWSLLPSPQKVADAPAASYSVMLLAGDGYLKGYSNMLQVHGASGDYWEGASEVEGGVMSPSHDRASIRVDWDRNEVPVFDVTTGAIVYRVPGVQSSGAVAFSGDGQWLAVAGGKSCVYCDSARVVFMRASDGEVMHDTTFSGHAWGVAFDRSRPLLYVGVDVPNSGTGGGFHPGILVLDSGTFARVGLLAPPPGGPACNQPVVDGGCYGYVLATSDEPAVYAIGDYHLMSWRFATGD